MKHFVCILICFSSIISLTGQSVYWVAPNGNNSTGDGSSGKPWKDITYALDQVSDKDTVVVKPGTYNGRIRLRGSFENGVVIKAQIPYQSMLRNNGTVVTCFYGQGITLQGFDIAHDGPGAEALVVQIQDLRGEVGDLDFTSRITIQNNILHDSYNNDILKINNGAKDILVDGNIFYNQAGSDEHIDINSVENIRVQNNIFMNDFEGSGRVNDNSTSSYIVIKDSNKDSDKIVGSGNIHVRKNVFLNWQGNTGQGFVRMGEDGMDFHEAYNVTVENNLMLGNSKNQIRSPIQIMNCKQITIRNNTIHGDLPAKEFGSRIFSYGTGAPKNDNITITGNIWSDPKGTMGDTYNRGNNTNNLSFYKNLHWNMGNAFPTSNESIIEVSADKDGIVGDPKLPGLSGIVLPRYNESTNKFADGSSSIREAFRKLAIQYGRPGDGSMAIDKADAGFAPDSDILGNPRNKDKPDMGAIEYYASGKTEEAMVPPPVYYNNKTKTLEGFTDRIQQMVLYDYMGKIRAVSESGIDLNGKIPGVYIVKGIMVNGQTFLLKFSHLD